MKNAPKNLEFMFGDEFFLEKKNDEVFIKKFTRSRNAQSKTDSENKEDTVKISEKDFIEIWKMISKIDFKKYVNHGKLRFAYPTDLIISTKLTLKIDDKVVVDWFREGFLDDSLRKPLDGVNNLIRKKFDEKKGF